MIVSAQKQLAGLDYNINALWLNNNKKKIMDLQNDLYHIYVLLNSNACCSSLPSMS